MRKLTERQLNIFDFIKKSGVTGNKEIKEFLEKGHKNISRVTVVRDVDLLLKQSLIKKIGKGRSVRYEEAVNNTLLAYLDIDDYFKKGPDERSIAFESFNFGVFENLNGIFSEDELRELEVLNDEYKKRVKKLSPAILKKEFERLTIELSWKSSRIEGNTYSLVDTEILIKENQEARGHKKEEAVMILNHKKALDYILSSKKDFKKTTLRNIENIHQLAVEGLGISRGLRKRMVGIVGTRYRPPDNEHQVREAMEKTVKSINNVKDPFSKSLAVMLMISYTQPFEDGNKRTARLFGDAILLAYNVCPLSFRSVDEGDYKRATILFYEQNNAAFFKELFIQQFKFAVENYFR